MQPGGGLNLTLGGLPGNVACDWGCLAAGGGVRGVAWKDLPGHNCQGFGELVLELQVVAAQLLSPQGEELLQWCIGGVFKKMQ